MSAIADELVHTTARQAVALILAPLRALKLRCAIDLPSKFLNMFDIAGSLGKRHHRAPLIKQWRSAL